MAIAFTDQPSTGPFHRTNLWHRTAPRELFKAWFSGDDERRWNVWKKHLIKRTSPAPLAALMGKRPAILWAWPLAWQRDEVANSTSPLARSNAVHTASRTSHLELAQVLQVVAAAYALPELAKELSAGSWWSLAETLHRLASDAQQFRVDAAVADPENVVRQQLLAGELPLVLGYLFPEVQPMRTLRAQARQALSEGIVALTDGEGLPHARLLPVIGPLWACWTRCHAIDEQMRRGAWTRDAKNQYLWLLRRMIRLVDADGQLVLHDADTSDEPSLLPILSAALAMAGDKGDAAATAAAISPTLVPRKLKTSRKKLPAPSLESAWAGLAVLAPDWRPTSPRLALNYCDDPLRVELKIGGKQVLLGDWTCETICDGQPLVPIGPWEELCWQSDDKCDFLEVGLPLAAGMQLERQLLLAKEAGILFVADAISSKERGTHQLRHSLSLPLARRVTWLPESETRDGILLAQKQRTAVIPLGLHEWRCDPRGGTLVGESGRLTLTEAATGSALYCGLVLDLKPARSKKERTWRQLTVSEALAPVARDVAVGFRVQSGDDQFVFYRSMGPLGNRAVLGQNIATEFVAGRFKTEDGLLDEWIAIETESD